MSSPHTDITNGVAAAINGATWSRTLSAVTSFADWTEELKDLGTLRCDVVGWPKPVVRMDTPSSLDHSIIVTIGVRYRAAATDRDSTGRIATATLQGLVDLLYEIAEYFAPGPTRLGRPLSGVPSAAMDPDRPVEIVFAYHPKHLLDWGQYTGLVRLRFLMPKAVA